MFGEFVRRGKYLTLEHAVKKITLDSATIWGIQNRGLLHRGYAADIVIFDFETIDRGDEIPVYDLPENGMRYIRASKGIEHTIVNGEVVWSANDGYTGNRPGMFAA